MSLTVVTSEEKASFIIRGTVTYDCLSAMERPGFRPTKGNSASVGREEHQGSLKCCYGEQQPNASGGEA